MKRITFTSILLLFLLVMGFHAEAQRRPGAPRQSSFLDSQGWLGIRMGANLSQAQVMAEHSVLQAINFQQEPREYFPFSQIGFQAGLDMQFYYRGFSVVFQPGYFRNRFEYTNRYEWEGQEPPASVELNYNLNNDLDFLDLPLLFRYDFSKGKWRPFIQAGAYYTRLMRANKNLILTGVDNASGGVNEFEAESFSTNSTKLFVKDAFGWIAGGGVAYHLGNIRLMVDFNYRQGFHHISHADRRYNDNRLAGLADVNDDWRLRSFAMTFGIAIPMKFLDTSFKSLN